ncbi:MAG: TetR/AcrR family transcriptional regulator [Melioribacteraceae bacterium]
MKSINENYIQGDTKQKIFNAAAELFARDGYHKTSVREICEAAKVTKPVLYYYFKDKETLLEALMIETYSRMDELMSLHLGSMTNLIEVITGLSKLYLEFLTKYPNLTKFSVFIQSTNVPKRILEIKMQRYKNEMERFINLIIHSQRKGLVPSKYDSEILAINFIGSITLLVVEYLLFDNDINKLQHKLNDFTKFWIKAFLTNDTVEN